MAAEASPAIRTIRIAVLGAGEWARTWHLPTLRALAAGPGRAAGLRAEIAGIWNRTVAKADEAARAFGIPRVYRSLAEVQDDESLDCCSVLVHSTALPEIVDRLLVRRLPIFCEKPPGDSYAAAAALARRVEVPNVVAFNRRYMPICRRFRALAEQVPDAYFVECHFHRSERLYDHFVRETGVHGINLIEHLFGPIRRTDTERLINPATGRESWICRVVFDSGTRGVLKFLPCCGASVERYEVHGNDTSLYLHVPLMYTSDHPGKIIVHRNGQVESVIEDASGDSLTTEGFVDEYLDFFRAVLAGSPTQSNFANACNTMRVAEAIETGAEVTRLV